MAQRLATFAVFTFNQAPFVRDTVRGALAQSYSPLQIIISDDCSGDGTFEIIEEVVRGYDGPHELIVRRNKTNLGLAANFNKVIAECVKGDVVVVSGGDDISLPNRTDVAVTAIDKWDVLAGCSNGWRISEDSTLIGPIFSSCRSEGVWRTRYGSLLGATSFYKRDLFKLTGGLPPFVRGEDMWYTIQALAHGKVVYSPELCVKYRQLDTSLMGSFKRNDYLEQLSIRQQQLLVLEHIEKDLAMNGLLSGKAKSLIVLLKRKVKFEASCIDSSVGILKRAIALCGYTKSNPRCLRQLKRIFRRV